MKNKILLILKNISCIFIKLKSFPFKSLNFIIAAVLLFSSINILPLIPGFNNGSNNVEAATAPQWGRLNYSNTNDNYKALPTSSILTASSTEKWVITNKAAKATVPYNAATPPDNSGSLATGTGTIKSSGITVTGSGTSFTTQLQVGDIITANSVSKTVTAIASNTSLTTDTAYSPSITVGSTFTHSRPILWGDPFVGGDGTVFVIGHSGFTSKLYAFDPTTGNVKTNYPYTITIPYDCNKVAQSTYFVNNTPQQTAIFKIAGIAPNGDVYVSMHGVRSCPDNRQPTPLNGYFEELSVLRLSPSGISAGANQIVNSAYMNNGNGGDYYDVDGITPDGDYFIVGQLRNAGWSLVSLKASDSIIWQNERGQWNYKPGVNSRTLFSGSYGLVPTAPCPGCHNTDGPDTSNTAFSVDGTMSYSSDGSNGNPLQQTTNIYHNGDSSSKVISAKSYTKYVMAITNNTNIGLAPGNHYASEMGLYTSAGNGYISMAQAYPYRGATLWLESKELAGRPLGVDKSGGNNYLFLVNGGTLRRIDMNSTIMTVGGPKCTNSDGQDQLYNCNTDLPNTDVGLGENVLDAVVTSGYIYYTTQSGGNIFFNIKKTSDLTTVFRKQYIGTGNGSISVADSGDVYWSTQNMVIAFGVAVPMTCTGTTVAYAANPVNVPNPAAPGTTRVTATGIKNASTVYFPTWSATAGQNDLIWYNGTQSAIDPTQWYVDIPLSNHIAGPAVNKPNKDNIPGFASGNGDSGYNVGDTYVHVYALNSITALTACNTTTPPFYINQPPTGLVTNNNTCTTISGYAFDRDKTNSLVKVLINVYKANTVASGVLTSDTVNATGGDRTTNLFNLSYDQSKIRDGITHLVTVSAIDPTIGSTIPNVALGFAAGQPNTITCDPNGWFIVKDAQSNSYKGFQNTAGTNNSINTPGFKPMTTGFSNSIITALFPPANFFSASDGNIVTTYQTNHIISGYKDANNAGTGSIFGTDPTAALPTKRIDMNDSTYSGAACNSVTSKFGGFTKSGANIAIDLKCINNTSANTVGNPGNLPYYINTTGNVDITYDISNPTFEKYGLGLYILNAANVNIYIDPNMPNSPNVSIMIVTNSKINVYSKNKTATYSGLNYFNMGLVSSQPITYNCTGYTAGSDVNGCQTIQNGFTYSETNINLTYKNTTDMGADGVTKKPSLEINYTPNYIYDFANQPTNTSYDFSTDFLGFDY